MKKMIKIAFVAAFAAIAGYGVYANQKTDVMSDLALANIEALADGGEGSGDCYGCAIYMQLVSVKIGDGVDVKDNRLYTMFN